MAGGSGLTKRIEMNLREIVFGLEDSLVSTLGAITGIAAGTGNQFVVILSGIVLIFVEALSMAAGSYLSAKSASEVQRKGTRFKMNREAVRAGAVMGVCYLGGGVFPLAFYFLLPVKVAILPSIVLTAIVLFALGAWKAKIVRTNWVRSGMEMMIVSLTAALLGFLIGRIVATLFGISVY